MMDYLHAWEIDRDSFTQKIKEVLPQAIIDQSHIPNNEVFFQEWNYKIFDPLKQKYLSPCDFLYLFMDFPPCDAICYPEKNTLIFVENIGRV